MYEVIHISSVGMAASQTVEQAIGSFVLFDLESTNLPPPWSKVAITEISLCAIAANKLNVDRLPACAGLPVTPRVLHKLTLLFNPRQHINPHAEGVTGLSNEILEGESHFDENAANAIISFLQHQRQPVCLVAHNGDNFDFPLLKQSFEKLKMQLPANVLCLDSMRAFMGIDEAEAMERFYISPSIQNNENVEKSSENRELLADVAITTPTTATEEQSKVDYRAQNETTPQRPIRTPAEKRSLRAICDGDNKEDGCSSKKIKARRALFSRPSEKKYPEKGRYPLGNMHYRIFGISTPNAHHAEADIEMLLNLVLAYGVDFLAYALNHAKPLAQVNKFGR